MINETNEKKAMKTNYQQQLDVIHEMQSQGFNVCTCSNCDGIILFNKQMTESDSVQCPHCGIDTNSHPDFYYTDCPEVINEINKLK